MFVFAVEKMREQTVFEEESSCERRKNASNDRERKEFKA